MAGAPVSSQPREKWPTTRRQLIDFNRWFRKRLLQITRPDRLGGRASMMVRRDIYADLGGLIRLFSLQRRNRFLPRLRERGMKSAL